MHSALTSTQRKHPATHHGKNKKSIKQESKLQETKNIILTLIEYDTHTTLQILEGEDEFASFSLSL